MKKIFLIILAVVLVGGGYFMFNTLSCTETPQDNCIVSNWKVYSNSQYGFSFKYPAVWSLVKELKASLQDYMPTWNDETYNGNLASLRTFVAIYPTTNQQDFAGRVDVYNTTLNVVKRDNPFLQKQSESLVSVNGLNWVKIGQNYLIEKNGQTYHISGPKDLTDTIVTTFSFIE